MSIYYIRIYKILPLLLQHVNVSLNSEPDTQSYVYLLWNATFGISEWGICQCIKKPWSRTVKEYIHGNVLAAYKQWWEDALGKTKKAFNPKDKPLFMNDMWRRRSSISHWWDQGDKHKVKVGSTITVMPTITRQQSLSVEGVLLLRQSINDGIHFPRNNRSVCHYYCILKQPSLGASLLIRSLCPKSEKGGGGGYDSLIRKCSRNLGVNTMTWDLICLAFVYTV